MKKSLKYIYSLIPFKLQLYSIIKKIFHPEERIYKHLHFKGPFKVSVNKNISFAIYHYGYQIENDIFWKGLTGSWEKRSIELWLKLSEKAKVVMDIGANTGIYSLIAKSVNPAISLIAIEPVERVFNKLMGNMRLNNFDIIAEPIAVSDHIGEVIFYDTIDEHPYTATIVAKPPSDSYFNPIKVQVNTIDNLIKEKSLDRLDLIKIDVEYHEPEVIKGFSLIGKYQPSILIEILTDDIGRRVEEQIENYGGKYLYFDIDEEKGIWQVAHIRKSSGMNYLLCTESVASEMHFV